MGRKEEDAGNLDRSEGAPPPASAFANGTAEALGASRMDQEEDADWDNDDEEQQELAAAAKGKVCAVCVVCVSNPSGAELHHANSAVATACSKLAALHAEMPAVWSCCFNSPASAACLLLLLPVRVVLLYVCVHPTLRPMARLPRRVVCWAALCPSWP